MRGHADRLSVVIVGEVEAETLGSLLPQLAPGRDEVVIVPGAGHPGGEPHTWERAAARCRGETIAFGPARGRFDPGWAGAIREARAAGAEVVAGPVRLEREGRLAARAAFLCDYAALSGPDAGSGAAAVNVAFDRRLLDDASDGDGLHKWELLRGLGRPPCWRPDMSVGLAPIRSFRAAGIARFRRGRHYAARRSCDWPVGLRLAAGLGCVALPALLLARMVGDRAVRRGHGWTLAVGLPWVVAALVAWSLGESVGYWRGQR